MSPPSTMNFWLRGLSKLQCSMSQVQTVEQLLRPSLASHPCYSSVLSSSASHSAQQQRSHYAFCKQGRRNSSQLARAIAPRPGTAAETYIAFGLTQKLFEACSTQADYSIPQLSQKGAQVPKTEAGEDLGVGQGWWYEGRATSTRLTSLLAELGLAPTFSTWSQVTFLHMYLLTVRLRALPSHDSFQTYSQHLIDHFSHDAEHRMDVLHGLTGRAIRNKFLKDLFIQWRGVLAAYDEGLVKGDAVLGAAVWRNLWKASHNGPGAKDLDWSKIAHVVAYMRRVLSELSQVNEADLITQLGRQKSGKPGIFTCSNIDRNMVNGTR
ncbi:ubiquinol-cytochrome C chaperone [Aspergillus heteromorphus CBS 117.55]|uniref:Ubiquinol-cytochrome C chaperone n=1 Tax=Aspergillus heteromorphus CBS 117.55 TaxID=1448321 RepID=A0A317UTS9_9EURO|nr:ubiquinol-cytochrome C chaperone [Aspergillus heteromorphus CBS 117.55]PWY63902.1 ubiquinol-cytochrome C chaperone [Aspergillus heteromorphus CBS 117.55]